MANRLAEYLKLTQAKEVAVNKAQVAELIGPELAEELAIFCVAKTEVRTTRVGPRSAIPPRNRIITAGLAQYNRVQLVEAIEKAQGASVQVAKVIASGVPNPAITPMSHVKKLQDRGLLPT